MGRKKEMMELRKKKLWTLAMIGERYGISRQRVAQIIGRTGIVSKIIKERDGGLRKECNK